ncbi:MAG: dihydroorotase [Spirochaetes bacterium]|nr:dihydroorotase [Spirochaetota bacterium]MBU0955886.1 dihydroorotase [Spirochaetota bacterium]
MNDGYQLQLALPDDFHVHLRQGTQLPAYARRSAAQFGRILVMPNTLPPICDGAALRSYRAEIHTAAPDCQALMTFKLVPGMGTAAVQDCIEAGAIAGKYYPAGATTNAADGVADPQQISDELALMQELDIVLSIHAEDPLSPAMEREAAFLPIVERLIRNYPKLRIVLEHLSSAAAVAAISNWPERVAATLTAHHLTYTIDDLLGDKLQPALFCKPLLKSAADRAALLQAATSGSPRFFFGSDSAPHPADAKLSAAAPAGSYTAPLALPLLARCFEAAGRLDRLEYFVSRAGADFYQLPPKQGSVLLTKKAWRIPERIDDAIPPEAGRLINWQAQRLP